MTHKNCGKYKKTNKEIELIIRGTKGNGTKCLEMKRNKLEWRKMEGNEIWVKLNNNCYTV